MRGEPDATPPPGCEWGPPQAFSAADLAPIAAAEIEAAEVGEAEWTLAAEAAELECRRAELETDQAFLADSWIRLQADREAHDASSAAAAAALEAERRQLRRTRQLQAAAAGVLVLWTLSLLEHSGVPSGAVFLTALVMFSALAWRYWGRAWVEGRKS